MTKDDEKSLTDYIELAARSDEAQTSRGIAMITADEKVWIPDWIRRDNVEEYLGVKIEFDRWSEFLHYNIDELQDEVHEYLMQAIVKCLVAEGVVESENLKNT